MSKILCQLCQINNVPPAVEVPPVKNLAPRVKLSPTKVATLKEPPLSNCDLDRWVITDQASFDNLTSQWVYALKHCLGKTKIMMLRFVAFHRITCTSSGLNFADLANGSPSLKSLAEINKLMRSTWKFDNGDWLQLGGLYIQQFDKLVGSVMLLRVLVNGKVQTTPCKILAKDAAAWGSYTVQYVDENGNRKEKNTSVERLEPFEDIDEFMKDFLVKHNT